MLSRTRAVGLTDFDGNLRKKEAVSRGNGRELMTEFLVESRGQAEVELERGTQRRERGKYHCGRGVFLLWWGWLSVRLWWASALHPHHRTQRRIKRADGLSNGPLRMANWRDCARSGQGQYVGSSGRRCIFPAVSCQCRSTKHTISGHVRCLLRVRRSGPRR